MTVRADSWQNIPYPNCLWYGRNKLCQYEDIRRYVNVNVSVFQAQLCLFSKLRHLKVLTKPISVHRSHTRKPAVYWAQACKTTPWWSPCLPAETLKVSVSVWPPGSNVYIGEYVLLQCTVESNSSFVGSYQWFRSKPTPNPRHLASGDSYSIAAVKREDADSYWCQAKRWESSTRSVLVSQQTTLSVSGEPQQQLHPLHWAFSCMHMLTPNWKGWMSHTVLLF